MAVRIEPPQSRSATLARAYGACLTLTERLDHRLRQHTRLVSSGWPRSVHEDLTEFSDTVDPAVCLTAERGTLIAAVHASADLGWPDLTWDLSLALQRFLESHHHFGDWHDVATAGLTAARAGGDCHAESVALCSFAELHLVQDRYAAAVDMLERALVVAREGDYHRVQARALLGLSAARTASGRFEDSAALARAALDLVDERLDPGIAAEAWMSHGKALYHQGELPAAQVSFQHGLDGFMAIGDRMNQAIALVNLGAVLSGSQLWAEAERAFNESAEICRDIGFRAGEGFAYASLGGMLRRTGATGRAERALIAALEIVRDCSDQFTEGSVLNSLGELFRSIDASRSRQYFVQAVELLGGSELPALLADALVGLGDTELAAGEPDRARAAWTRARDIIDPDDTDRVAGVERRLAESPTRLAGDPRVSRT